MQVTSSVENKKKLKLTVSNTEVEDSSENRILLVDMLKLLLFPMIYLQFTRFFAVERFHRNSNQI